MTDNAREARERKIDLITGTMVGRVELLAAKEELERVRRFKNAVVATPRTPRVVRALEQLPPRSQTSG